MAGGEDNTASGNHSSVAGGDDNTASGNHSSVAGGQNNTASGRYSSVAGGVLNTAPSYAETVMGSYATTYTPASTTAFNPTDYVLRVGNGTDFARSDAFQVRKDGMAFIDSTLTINFDDAANSYVFPAIRGTAGQTITTDATGNLSWATPAAGGLTHFTETSFTTTDAGSVFTPSGTGTDLGIVLQPKGNGYLSADQPDSTTTGGNARGSYAIDWQADRNNAAQVASGNSAVIAGGQGNTASGDYAVIAGGQSNTASGSYYSSVAGGAFNTASNTYASVVGGLNNTASGYASSVAGGRDNTASSNYSSVAGGYDNTASGQASSVAGGYSNIAPSYAETVMGSYATTYTPASTTAFNANDYMFRVGNGTGTAARSDAFQVRKDGRVTINEEYHLPITKGTAGQTITTDGSGNLSWTTPAAGGLTHFTETSFTTTDAGSVFTPSGTGTNLGIVLQPKGNGYLSADQPDGTTAGGNARGSYAIDWQAYRNNAAQVASGNYAVIAGGYGNTASGNVSFVAGGRYNAASGYTSSVAGGEYNTASGYTSSVAGGRTNTASGYASSVAGGQGNTASSNYSSVAGGQYNTASGNGSFVAGGRYNAASGNYSSIAGGYLNSASGDYSFVAGGYDNIISGNYSSAGGLSNTAIGEYSFVAGGLFNIAPSYAETVMGSYATTYTPASTTAFNANDYMFRVGNGTGTAARSDAFQVRKDGRVTINEEYHLPITKGTAGQTITTDATGNLSWTAPTTNTDNQNLSISGNTLSISGGTGVTLPTELPTGGSNGEVLKTDGSGNLSWTTPTTNTDNQNLSISGNTLSISGGTGVTLPKAVGWSDNRGAAPGEFPSENMSYAFGHFNNTSGAYADLLVMRGWYDASGGSDNMLAFNKSGIGMRIYQQSYGSNTNFSNYKEAVLAEPNGNVSLNGITALNNNELRLRTITDASHALQWTTNFAGINVDGPALYGWKGGVLGSTNGGQKAVLRWLNNGNVGIGTDNPSERLHIKKDGGLISRLESNAGSDIWTFHNYGNTLKAAAGWRGGSSNHYSIYVNGSDRLVVKEDGDVGIGTANPNSALHVVGDIQYSGTLIQSSDRRLKENFETIDSVLYKLKQIEGLSYNLKADSTKARQYGVIAQEIQKVFPDMVSIIDADSGYIGVSYTQLIPVLLEAVKELANQSALYQSEATQQKQRVEGLETENAQLKADNEAMKATLQSILNRMDKIEAHAGQAQQSVLAH